MNLYKNFKNKTDRLISAAYISRFMNYRQSLFIDSILIQRRDKADWHKNIHICYCKHVYLDRRVFLLYSFLQHARLGSKVSCMWVICDPQIYSTTYGAKLSMY